MDTKVYWIEVVDSDTPAAWQRLGLREQWGDVERRADGTATNVVRIEVRASDAQQLEDALERDDTVLSYQEVV